MFAIIFAAAAGLTVGLIVGMWGASRFWPHCSTRNCGRPLACPVCDAAQIRQTQQSAGPRATADVR